MPIIWFLVLVANLLLLLQIFHKEQEGMIHLKYLKATVVVVVMWVATELLIHFSYEEWFIYLIHEAKFLGILLLPSFLYCFITEYFGVKSVATNYLIAKTTIDIVLFILVMTDRWHGLFRISKSFVSMGQHAVVVENGILYYLIMGYVYVMVLFIIIRLIVYMVKIPYIYRKPIHLILLGIVFALTSNFVFQVYQRMWGANFDLTPISFGFIAWIFYYAIFKYNHYELSSYAKEVILDELSIGMLFLDYDEKVYYMNLLCEKVIGPYNTLNHKDRTHLPEVFNACIDESILTKSTIKYKTAKDQIYIYDVYAKRVTDDDGRMIGTLVRIVDITHEEINRINQQIKSQLL